MVSLRVLCVDDEAKARRSLEGLLEKMPEVEQVISAGTSEEASRLISTTEPHVMMVEAEFRDGTAFDMLNRLGKIPPVVFVASCPRHAVRAFELPALDYILKPAPAERLRTALARVRDTLQNTGVPETSLEDVAADSPACESHDFWVRRNRSCLIRVPMSSIDYATSADDYVCLHARGREYLVRESLGAIQGRFAPGEFVRINRSALVRVSAIAEIRSRPSGCRQIVLACGARLNVGRVLGRAAVDALARQPCPEFVGDGGSHQRPEETGD